MSLPHGGNIYLYSKMYNIEPEEILDFSASINPLGPPKSSVAALKEAAEGAIPAVVNYPDPDSALLKDAISGRLGVPRESFLIGNGSTELIYLIPRALRPNKALLPVPSFSDYARALRLSGTKIAYFALKEESGFTPDMPRLRKAATASDIVFLCNPNNPTGALMDRKTVLDLAKHCRKSGTLLVIDEAFIEYAPEASIARDAASLKNVIVLRNFTKFYGMPGLRAGYLIASPALVKRLAALKEPWSLNALAERAAAAALTDPDYEEKSIGLVSVERERLAASLAAIPGLKVFPSEANFLLVKIIKDELDADSLVESLAERGLLVRSCSNFRGLDNSFIRIAVKLPGENDVLISALYDVLTNSTA